MENININQNRQDNPEKSGRNVWKLLFVLTIIFLGLTAIAVKLFFIQLVNTDEFEKKAELQQRSKMLLRGERGKIFDRKQRLLASTIRSYSIAVDPVMMRKEGSTGKIREALKKMLGIGDSLFDANILNEEASFVWIKRGLSTEAYLPLDSISIPGLIKIPEPRRNYFFGSEGSQIIGSTNIDNVGRNGIEQTWDETLAGDSAYVVMLKDAFGNLRPSVESYEKPDTRGNSLVLTIDIDLQRIVEDELKKGVLENKANSGTAIAVDPKTGEILAIASYPGYNPNNIYQESVSGMRIRAITDTYEPGSTFKLITAAAALEERILSPGDTLDGMQGKLDIGDFVITDAHPVGKITFAEALERSSNVIFSSIANSMHKNIFRKYIRDFGFGNKLGIDVIGEVPGKLKKASDFDASTKRFMGYGYGLAVTPLQIAMAYAAAANGGELMQPRVVKKIISSDGEVIKESKPKTIRRVISRETADTLTNMLCNVVSGEHGTAKAARIEGLKIAGKTGTSKKLVEGRYGSGSYVASFAGYLPAEDPKMVILVVIDNPKTSYYGGSTAAPVFKRIALKAVNACPYLFDSDEKEYVYAFKNDSIFVPNLTGMHSESAVKILNKAGLKLHLPDTCPEGIIIEQSLPYGKKAMYGSEITAVTLDTANAYDRIRNLDMRGLSARRALALVQAAGCSAELTGSGMVYSVTWKGSRQNCKCIIKCR